MTLRVHVNDAGEAESLRDKPEPRVLGHACRQFGSQSASGTSLNVRSFKHDRRSHLARMVSLCRQ